MLGWVVNIRKQKDYQMVAAGAESPAGALLACWQTASIEWLTSLARKGKAVDLGGDGYPWKFTAQSRYIIPLIVDGPPGAIDPWVHGPDDVIGEGYIGKTTINSAEINECDPEEWLLITAWDES